ncbi:hypothetical protein [Capnocytophaga sp.]|uniref:hypothetical protein n=1 Tax=Capnocytophaga sp. TaxID=44737 RepID=UPI0026DB9383|nr:hypothetical protein [Capnocytophaga sp.]MDO5106109.1 hypothetical protein [Capnocytophaga sp.]
MKKLVQLAVISIITMSLSCSKKEDSKTDDTQLLSWEMEGEHFSAKGGYAFKRDNTIAVYITPQPSDCASKVYELQNYLSVDIPVDGISDNYNVVFKNKNKLMNAFRSKVKHQYNDKEVTIWVEASTVTGEKANGKFTVPYCK